MKHLCSVNTDLDELIGHDERDASGYHFCYGPLPLAMKNGEELVLENSAALSELTLAKIRLMVQKFVLVETKELIRPVGDFHLTLS